MKPTMIAIGNFFFKWRNYLFPLFIIALFIFRAPSTLFLGSEILEHAKDAVALGLVILGLAIRGVVIGFAYIKRGGMNKKSLCRYAGDRRDVCAVPQPALSG